MKSKSYFLFGPRGVGKTTLIRDTLSQGYQIMVSCDSTTRQWNGGIECFPVEEFLIALAAGEFG